MVSFSQNNLLYYMYSADTQDKGMIHVLSGMEQDVTIFYHTTKNSAQSKT